jgi:hypothetical protein
MLAAARDLSKIPERDLVANLIELFEEIDVNGDGTVNGLDLGVLLGTWG